MKTKQNVMSLAIIWLFLLIPAKMFAQTDTSATAKREKIQAQKVAYITQKLVLTVEESQKFWPVYNEYDAQKEVLNKAYRQKMKAYKKATITEAQADSIIIADISHDQALLDLKKLYIAKFKAVIPATKVAKLSEAEREFKRMLLKLIKEPRKEGVQKKYHR
jgi:hypothetical protein